MRTQLSIAGFLAFGVGIAGGGMLGGLFAFFAGLVVCGIVGFGAPILRK